MLVCGAARPLVLQPNFCFPPSHPTTNEVVREASACLVRVLLTTLLLPCVFIGIPSDIRGASLVPSTIVKVTSFIVCRWVLSAGNASWACYQYVIYKYIIVWTCAYSCTELSRVQRDFGVVHNICFRAPRGPGALNRVRCSR